MHTHLVPAVVIVNEHTYTHFHIVLKYEALAVQVRCRF